MSQYPHQQEQVAIDRMCCIGFNKNVFNIQWAEQ
jgi:hypothetical protein